VISGPNGAGKTTFARDYLPAIAGLIHFVNLDLIAGGISPLRPELAAVTAGRLVLRELDRLVEAKADFAFESTLSGLRYAKRMQDWKAQGYSIEIAYLRLVDLFTHPCVRLRSRAKRSSIRCDRFAMTPVQAFAGVRLILSQIGARAPFLAERGLLWRNGHSASK